MESVWDREEKQSRIHVIRHLGGVVDRNGRKETIPPESRFSSIDMAYPAGSIALF